MRNSMKYIMIIFLFTVTTIFSLKHNQDSQLSENKESTATQLERYKIVQAELAKRANIQYEKVAQEYNKERTPLIIAGGIAAFLTSLSGAKVIDDVMSNRKSGALCFTAIAGLCFYTTAILFLEIEARTHYYYQQLLAIEREYNKSLSKTREFNVLQKILSNHAAALSNVVR